MRIFQSGTNLNNINDLVDTPSLNQAAIYWTNEGLYEKSSIDLRIFHTEFGTISLLYGPRQIGKTSALRQFLTLLTDSQTICYLDCSIILDRKDLYQHLSSIIEGNTTIVLDEVQEVEGWHLALRALHGEGRLENCRVWCTGSEARYILEGGERLPGRKGKGKVIFARPWSFREYMDILFPEVAKEYQQINFKHVNQKWLLAQTPDWQTYWESYQLSGGIPYVIGEIHTTGKIKDEVWRVYEDWVLGTWSQLRTPERSLRQLAKKLNDSIGSRTSFDALKKGSDILSSNTVKSLLEMQEDHFSIRTLTRFNVSTGSFTPAKLKKFYPLNTFIAQVYRAIGNRCTRDYQNNLNSDNLDECAFYSQTLKYENHVDAGFLYHDKSKTEIDFFHNDCAFELKSNGAPSKKQWEMLNRCPHAFVVNQKHLPLMSYLIGESRISTL